MHSAHHIHPTLTHSDLPVPRLPFTGDNQSALRFTRSKLIWTASAIQTHHTVFGSPYPRQDGPVPEDVVQSTDTASTSMVCNETLDCHSNVAKDSGLCGICHCCTRHLWQQSLQKNPLDLAWSSLCPQTVVDVQGVESCASLCCGKSSSTRVVLAQHAL